MTIRGNKPHETHQNPLYYIKKEQVLRCHSNCNLTATVNRAKLISYCSVIPYPKKKKKLMIDCFPSHYISLRGMIYLKPFTMATVVIFVWLKNAYLYPANAIFRVFLLLICATKVLLRYINSVILISLV